MTFHEISKGVMRFQAVTFLRVRLTSLGIAGQVYAPCRVLSREVSHVGGVSVECWPALLRRETRVSRLRYSGANGRADELQ